MKREDSHTQEIYKEQLIPTELTSEEELAQFWLAVYQNNGMALFSDPEKEKKAALREAKLTLYEIRRADHPVYFFGIKKDNRIIATGKLDIRTKDETDKDGYLSFLSVDENLRGKGLSKQLENIRVEYARRNGCSSVSGDVFTENPIALVTKLNDDYTVIGLEFYDDDKQAGKFTVTKKINGKSKHERKKEPLGELREIQLSNLPAIKILLDQGWVGIDVKNLSDAKDKNPEQWMLIMEKTTENVTKENETRQEQPAELKDYFKKAEIVVLAETHHGAHLETIMKFLNQFLSQINGIFFEIPVTYQSSFDLYMKTGETDEKLKKFFADAEREGKNIRGGLLLLLDKIKQFGKQAVCVDSSKLPTEEYPHKSRYGVYFLRGESRDEDMFDNISTYYQKHPGKYLVVAGATHVKQKKHHDSGDDTMGQRLTKLFTDKLTTILMGTSEAIAEEETSDYNEIIVE
ncbi:MAG: GNAT family N-acetyltransferase [Candidatus Magasanikbacteria bacterium]|nr:GNAT family N-acetyltransferase [Candidatus Magasanikbacteria bacterium]